MTEVHGTAGVIALLEKAGVGIQDMMKVHAQAGQSVKFGANDEIVVDDASLPPRADKTFVTGANISIDVDKGLIVTVVEFNSIMPDGEIMTGSMRFSNWHEIDPAKLLA